MMSFAHWMTVQYVLYLHMSRSLSPTTLRRKAIKDLEAAIELATRAGDYRMMARYANQLATIAKQIEIAKIASSRSRAVKQAAMKQDGSTAVPSTAVIIET